MSDKDFFSLTEIRAIRNALETEIDRQGLMIEAWEIDTNGTLKRVYGKKRYRQIIEDDKKYLKLLLEIDKRFFDKLKSLKDLSGVERK
jgi:hypothetical protein